MQKFYRTSAGKPTFRTQNDTDSANFPSARKKTIFFVRSIRKVHAELVCGKLIFSHFKF